MGRVWAVLAFLLLAAPAAAQQAASMNADQAYVQAVAYMQNEFAKLRADQQLANEETKSLRAQLADAQAELQRLKAAAQQNNVAARATLAAFAQGKGEAGIDAQAAQAKTAEDWRRVGALAFAVDTNRATKAYEQVLRLAPGDIDSLKNLQTLYDRAGRLDDVARVNTLLAASNDAEARFVGLLNRGFIAELRADFSSAERDYNAALAAAVGAGQKVNEARALARLAIVFQQRNDLDQAEALEKRALAASEAAGDKRMQAFALTGLSVFARQRDDKAASDVYNARVAAIATSQTGAGATAETLREMGEVMEPIDPKVAQTYYERALALDEKADDKWGQADDLWKLGYIALAYRFSPEAARPFYERALTLVESLGHKRGQAESLRALGTIDFMQGQNASAAERQKRALATFESLGDKQFQAILTEDLGDSLSRMKDVTQACSLYRRSLGGWDSLGPAYRNSQQRLRSKIAQDCTP